jgi:capsular exopolysaccharide synthesis family protein
MVTSPHPGDGKTSLAMNLASSLAQGGSGDVLLVDGNLRSPQLHAILNVTRSPGMASFLAGRAELEEVIRETFVPRLSLIPGDRCPDNPADLLAGRRLEEALETLGDRFAHIIVDAPPLFGMSDSLNLAARLDGVVLVLRHGRSRREDARSAVEQLWWVRANLLGVVVNGVDGDLAGRAAATRGRRRDDRDHDDADLEDTA